MQFTRLVLGKPKYGNDSMITIYLYFFSHQYLLLSIISSELTELKYVNKCLSLLRFLVLNYTCFKKSISFYSYTLLVLKDIFLWAVEVRSN